MHDHSTADDDGGGRKVTGPGAGDTGAGATGAGDTGAGATGAGETRGTRRHFLKAAGAAGVVVGGGLATSAVGSVGADVPLEPLHREENVVKDPSDNIVTLRGVNTIDAARAGGVDEYIREATNENNGWHSTIVRMPMQPQDMTSFGGSGEPDPGVLSQGEVESYLDSYVESAVDTARQEGVYLILDYHRHWPVDEGGVYWDADGMSEELQMFWETVAPRYADEDHVVYEVYNEPNEPYAGDPTDPNDADAEGTWLDWREQAQPWVDTIREHAPENLVLVGSPQWSQFTAQAPHNEFDGEDLVYVGHIYTQVTGDGLWDYFGTPSEEVPVWMTEFGWSPSGQDHWIGTNEEDGQNFLDFYADHPHVSWTAWCFDTSWGPPMLSSYWQPNEYGEFVRQELEARQDDYHTDPADVPGYDGASTPTPTATPTPGDGCPDGEDAPAQIDGVYPQDLDGDGRHRDLNGNCRLDSDDVVTYFEHMEDPAITDNVAAYDYNGNERIDFDDVVVLFESI